MTTATSHFNKSKNLEKAVAGLSGILLGITADKKLNEQELLFLDVWLRSQNSLRDDDDIVDLLDTIKDILADGVVTGDELAELQDLVANAIEHRDVTDIDVPCQINELIGLLCGIAADDVLKDSEIQTVIDWTAENDNTLAEWPINIILKRLDGIIIDGEISDENRAQLLEMIKQITGVHFSETGTASASTTEFFEDNIDSIIHDGSSFCFTGVFMTGTRTVVQNIAKEKGAKTTKDVSKNTNYLVIGATANADWRFASYGRKIERALQLKADNHPITIITEQTWLQHV